MSRPARLACHAFLGVLAGIALLVLSGGAQAQSRLVPSADGHTVYDWGSVPTEPPQPYELTLQRCAEGMSWDGKTCAGEARKMSWAAAFDAAAAANAENDGAGRHGFNDWRVPSHEELQAVVVNGGTPPVYDVDAFPDTPKALFWASTQFPLFLTPDLVLYIPMAMSFDNGKPELDGSGAGPNHLRLVRGGNPAHIVTVTASVTPGTAHMGSVSPPSQRLSKLGTGGGTARIVATPKSGYEIASSIGDSCTAKHNGNLIDVHDPRDDCDVRVSFALRADYFEITASAVPQDPAITVPVGHIVCDPNPVAQGETVECTATAEPGFHLARFREGDCDTVTASNSVCELTNVQAARSVQGIFAVNRYAVTGKANPPEDGDLICDDAVSHGASATCTATPNPGYSIASISGCAGTPTGAGVTSFTTGPVTAACTVTARFLAEQILTFPPQDPASHVFVAGGTFPIDPPATSSNTRADAPPITYSSLTTGICTVSGTTVTMLAPGTCTIAADQAGDANHTAAPQQPQRVALNAQTSFSGTTVPPAGGTPGPATANFTGGGAACRFDTVSTAFIAAPAAPPASQSLPQGMFQFKLIGCDATPVSMNITWPQAVSGYTKYGKASAGAVDSYFAPDNLSVSGNTVSFTVQDGQKGDDDWTVNGEIVDPSGPMAAVGAVTAVPTLGQWSLLLLGLLAAGLGARRLQRGQ